MPVRLAIAIHNHQPVGNFDWVFSDVTARCYRPFLEALARHPGVRLSMHWSGPLLEWLESHDAPLLDRLGALVSRGQVELLGGPFYEPILPAIPHWDQEGQIARSRDYLRGRFGVDAEGAWIPERVWEPDLPDVLARCGIRYTLLDDHHFLLAGLSPETLRESYRVESTLGGVGVFPIERELRYRIPFAPVPDLLRYLESSASAPDEIRVFGDDGEKFGAWPSTYEWVYPEGWLERWLSELEEGSRVVSIPLREAWRDRPPVRRAALPAASYPEMMLWSLPPEAQGDVEEAERVLTDEGRAAWARRLAGGSWRSFLARYTEARRANRRATAVSARIEGLACVAGGEALREEARREIQRAQCNCAYWHGIFGGLYLPHLRQAIREHTIRAEALADRAEGAADHWAARVQDGEARIRSGRVAVTVDLEQDGDLVEIAWRPRPFDFTDVMMRRFEAYHSKLAGATTEGSKAESVPETIHGAIQLKEPGLAQHVEYDARPRAASQEALLSEERRTRDGTLRDAARAWGRAIRYGLEASGDDREAGPGGTVPAVRLVGRPDVAGEARDALVIRKQVVAGDRLEAFRVLLEAPIDGDHWLLSEWNLSLLTPDAPGRRLSIAGDEPGSHAPGSRGVSRGVRSIRLEDAAYLGLAIVLEVTPAASLEWTPVETISLSEAGVERLYQGTSLLLGWRGRPEAARCSIDVRLEETAGAA